jgi:NAD(P)-dependent dehydrogenase (short-subunit alcohol dehydrogenase family)
MGTATFDFSGAVVLVTGGSRGLGFEIAQAFGSAGATVIITARREQWLAEAGRALQEQGIPVHTATCDVADAVSVAQAVQQCIEKFGQIDVLVNNAGLTWGTPAEQMSLERWHQVLEANVTGTFLMSQAVGRHMLERKHGAIVNVASVAGLGGASLIQSVTMPARQQSSISRARWLSSGPHAVSASMPSLLVCSGCA